MRATQPIPEHRLPRFRWPHRHIGFMTPLPPRRKRERGVASQTGSAWDPWWGRQVHLEIPGPLRNAAFFILWLLVVLGMILLLEGFWK